jgi:hypothetical protein
VLLHGDGQRTKQIPGRMVALITPHHFFSRCPRPFEITRFESRNRAGKHLGSGRHGRRVGRRLSVSVWGAPDEETLEETLQHAALSGKLPRKTTGLKRPGPPAAQRHSLHSNCNDYHDDTFTSLP